MKASFYKSAKRASDRAALEAAARLQEAEKKKAPEKKKKAPAVPEGAET